MYIISVLIITALLVGEFMEAIITSKRKKMLVYLVAIVAFVTMMNSLP